MICSSASEQVVASINLFHSVMVVEGVELELTNVTTVKSRHKFKVLIDPGIMPLMWSIVCFIATLQVNLLSCSRLDEYGITTSISKKNCNLVYREQNKNKLAAISQQQNAGLHVVNTTRPQETDGKKNFSASHESNCLQNHEGQTISDLRHRRLGRANELTLSQMIKDPLYYMRETCVR